MSERERIVLGGAVLVAACVPKVPASIVVDETRRPDHEQRAAQPERPKPPPGPDRTPPEVVRAELTGGTRLRIHFSEPIVVSENFDPRDFRLSQLVLYLHQQVEYSNAYYGDIGYVTYSTAMAPSGVRVGGDKIEIEFTPEIPQWFCDQVHYGYGYYNSTHGTPSTKTEAGLFLHYAAGSIPIRDEAGNQMSNFGQQWVELGRQQPPQAQLELSGAAAIKAGAGLIRISCAPELPPGPR